MLKFLVRQFEVTESSKKARKKRLSKVEHSLRVEMTAFTLVIAAVFILNLNVSLGTVVKVTDYRQCMANKGLSNWLTFERHDLQQGITHTEFFRSPVAYRISRLPILGKIFKPLAKVGIRTRSVPSQGSLEEYIKKQFNDSEPNLSLKLGLLVYMWVAPRWRGRKLGDMLLSIAVEQCLSKGDKYMLCVHDDQGSGKLVEWYKHRRFEVMPTDVLDKGLICMLRSA